MANTLTLMVEIQQRYYYTIKQIKKQCRFKKPTLRWKMGKGD